jgi:hypothetical protein
MSNRRLTQSMRQVLRNLIEGKPVQHGFMFTQVNNLDCTVSVLGGLRKRGLVTRKVDGTHEITPQGREALDQHNRSIN